MTSFQHQSLGWLARPPADFSARCKAIAEGGDGWDETATFLASHALDTDQLYRLGRAAMKARDRSGTSGARTTSRLAIISNATADLLIYPMVATGLRYGLTFECVLGEFGKVMHYAHAGRHEIFDPKPDVVLLCLDYRALPLEAAFGNRDQHAAAVQGALSFLEEVSTGIKKNSDATVIMPSFARPPNTLFGSLDGILPGTLSTLLNEINGSLGRLITDQKLAFVDVAALAENVGLLEWHDPVAWNIAKQPFAQKFLPVYADHVCRTISSQKGSNGKVLVLDLDNTLWGGVIGDDGLEGIEVGAGSPLGEAHIELQQAALSLRSRGILLAVSSKNNDETARAPFRDHPDMALKESHFAAFQANWSDKATNIRAMSKELDLGLSAFVFLDDNPVERDLVRSMLPSVRVIELPEDPSLYARTLLSSGFFESAQFSQEDTQRSEYYKSNKKRLELSTKAGDIDSYLASLDMIASIYPFDAVGRSRIVQLINKSNQYNLTTRRYSESQVAEFESSSRYITMQVRLVDVFGDNGMISVVIAAATDDTLEIDTWLMSCRVLGRHVERAVLRSLLDFSKQKGIRKIVGHYIPSGRNEMVATHYQNLGFGAAGRSADGSTRWELEVANAPQFFIPIALRQQQS